MKIIRETILIVALLSALCCNAEASSEKKSFEQAVFDSAYLTANETFKEIWGFDLGSPESSFSKPLQLHKGVAGDKKKIEYQENLKLNGYIFQIPGARVTMENKLIAIRSKDSLCAVFGSGYEDLFRDALKIPKELKQKFPGSEAELLKIEAKLESLRALSTFELHRSIYASSSEDLDENNPLAKRIAALYLLGFKPNLVDPERTFHYENEDTILIITHPRKSGSYSGSFSGALFPKNLDCSFTIGGKISSSKTGETFFENLVWRLLKTNIIEEAANKSEPSIPLAPSSLTP